MISYGRCGFRGRCIYQVYYAKMGAPFKVEYYPTGQVRWMEALSSVDQCTLSDMLWWMLYPVRQLIEDGSAIQGWSKIATTCTVHVAEILFFPYLTPVRKSLKATLNQEEVVKWPTPMHGLLMHDWSG